MGKYLDSVGVSYLWSKIKARLDTKMDGLRINGSKYSVSDAEVNIIAGSGITFTVEQDSPYTNCTISSSGGGSGRQTTYYTTCSTAASTAAKEITVEGWTPTAGDILTVLFTSANTAATPTLNVNSLGAKSIYIGNSTPNSTTNVLKWSASATITFMYDGTYYRYLGMETPAGNTQGGGTWYGTSATAATTAAKTSTITNFKLTPGAVVCIKFSTANTYASGAITLNVNSTGAKTIYANNAATSNTNPLFWDAGDILTFIYSSSYWYFVSNSNQYGGDSWTLPAVLYANPSGSNETITLEDSAANYDYMRIYFRKDGDSEAHDSVDIHKPNGKRASLFLSNAYSSSAIQFVGQTVTISGNTITPYNTGGYYNVNGGGAGTASKPLYITRVEAWNGGASGGGGGGGSQIDLLWTNPNPTSNFAAQTLSGIPWQDYRFLIIDHYTIGNGNVAEHYETSIISTANPSIWSWITCIREVPFGRGVKFPADNQVQFGNQTYYDTYNGANATLYDDWPFIIPTKIWGVKESSGGSVQAADYIVQIGETDGWHWEKWYSGRAEAWATKTHSVTINENYGNGWYSSEQHDDIPSGIFTSMEAVTLSGYGSGAGFSIEYGGGQTTTSTGGYWLMRVEGSAQPSTAYISIIAKGRWK